MTRFSSILLLAALLAPAQTLTKGERERAMSELHASRKMLIDAVAGLSEKQLNWKAAPERWSIAEVAEHLALSEDFLFGLYKSVAASPADPAKSSAIKDEDFMKTMRDRSQKATAPEAIAPKKTFASTAAALAAFKERRDAHILYVETTQDDGLRHKLAPNFGMDGYQIFLMIASHTERHCAQIAEVKAAAGYPAK